MSLGIVCSCSIDLIAAKIKLFYNAKHYRWRVIARIKFGNTYSCEYQHFVPLKALQVLYHLQVMGSGTVDCAFVWWVAIDICTVVW